MDDAPIYKVLHPGDIAKSEAAGITCTGLDTADGYVHLSRADQLAETLALHFKDVDGALLLEYAPGALGANLKWERSRGGALFPHYYGELSLSLARRRWTLHSAPDGRLTLPEDL